MTLQGNLTLFSTSFRVADLLIDNFYSIERLDPDNPDDKGYQRLLNTGRSKKLADYLIDGQGSHDAFLPTSIFLATEKDISFDLVTNTITFDVAKIGPFSVVDGQHRLEGLRLAAAKCPELLSFEVPANIAVNLPTLAQMCHFLIVNTTQKSVDRSVEQRIYARLTQAMSFEDVPHLPRWMRRLVESGDDEQALRLVDHLNTSSDSPWFGKIEMANEDVKTSTISQRSFVKAIKKYVLTANNPISVKPAEHQNKIFLNYWKAIANILSVGQPTWTVPRTTALNCFAVFRFRCLRSCSTLATFGFQQSSTCSRCTFEKSTDYAAVGHPDWWLSGSGPAGGLNAGALNKINQDLTKALHTVESAAAMQV